MALLANFQKLLSGGDKRSIAQADIVVQHVLDDLSRFDELFELLGLGDELLTMRSLDAIEKVSRRHTDCLQAYKSFILNKLAKYKQKEVKWHVAQLLPRLILSSAEKKKVFTLLEKNYLCDKSSIVKTNALQALADIAQQDKTLKAKVTRLLKGAVIAGTPAMQSRARKLLQTL